MEKSGNPWLGTFLGLMREAGTPAPKRRMQDTDEEVDMVQCAKRQRLESSHAELHSRGHNEQAPAANSTNQISAYYARTNPPQSNGRLATYSNDRPPSHNKPSSDSRTINPPFSSGAVRRPTYDNRTHGGYINPLESNPDLARSLAYSQQIASNLARLQSSPLNPVGPTTHQEQVERASSPAPHATAGLIQGQSQQVLGRSNVKNALPVSNGHGQKPTLHELPEGGPTKTPLSLDKPAQFPSPYVHESGPQTDIPSHAHSPEQPTHSISSPGGFTNIPSIPRLPTYYEHTGGTHTNLSPSKSGVYANQDFKTGRFIDSHGAPFTNRGNGQYRWLRPVNRGQELAIMQATYQTISDFEIIMGFSPNCFIDTMQSYERQYQQIQQHLEEIWDLSPESIPKLKSVQGWNKSHLDHAIPTPLAVDTIPAWFIRCQPGVTTSQPCCIEHENETWTKMGCVRNLENRMWQDWGDQHFSAMEAKK